MILSVCPNPSVDCTIELDTLKTGGLNRVENKIITYSGKALNVAVGIARLGGDSFATGFMFDENGKKVFHYKDIASVLDSGDEDEEDDAMLESIANVLLPFLVDGLLLNNWDPYYENLQKEISELF